MTYYFTETEWARMNETVVDTDGNTEADMWECFHAEADVIIVKD